MFSDFFGENILKTITSVPSAFLIVTMVFVSENAGNQFFYLFGTKVQTYGRISVRAIFSCFPLNTIASKPKNNFMRQTG
jgi:hypothetical protein